MKFTEYTNMLEYKLQAYYNTQRNYEFDGEVYDLKATYIERNEQYIATKKTVVWDYEQYQHILLKSFETIDLKKVEDFTKALVDFTAHIVEPSSSHMSTLVSGVILTDGGITEDIIKYVQKFKYYKSFKFGLNGWVNIALNLLDINNIQDSYYNKKGKEDSKNFIILSDS